MTEDLPTTAIAPSTPEARGILTPAPNTTECNDTRKSKPTAQPMLQPMAPTSPEGRSTRIRHISRTSIGPIVGLSET
jgi:hypothetical protein